MPKRALLLVNRKSRSGNGNIDSAVERLRGRGVDIVDVPVDRPEAIPDLIRRHCGEVDCVIVGGGDGSMSTAAAALIETGLPLGVLPLGTANDLARTLNIPADLEKAIDIIADGVLHRIDLGKVNDRYFFNIANIGLGVHVTHHLSPDMKRRWGILSYARSLIKSLRQFRPFYADITCDGRRRRVRTIQIAVGNGRHYGGGMTITEGALIDDHLFMLCSLEPLGFWQFFKMAPAFRAGRFDAEHPVFIEQGRSVEIVTQRAMHVSADGELVTRTPVRFEMIPSAIAVFVPKEYFSVKQEIIHAA